MNDTPNSKTSFERIRAKGGGPLALQLLAYSEDISTRNPALGKAYQDLVDKLIARDAGDSAPVTGDTLPPFLLPDETGQLISSEDLLATGPLVISFNRGNWCPFCWLELGALDSCVAAIQEKCGSVISITPETAHFSKRLKDQLGLSFPVLSDLDNGYALKLGLVMAIPLELQEIHRRSGTLLPLFQQNEAWFVPLPATLIVDQLGIIRESFVNADFRQRIEPGHIPEIVASLS